jgi:hypothetical protein
MSGAISPLPNMSSWRGASLRTGTILSLLLTIVLHIDFRILARFFNGPTDHKLPDLVGINTSD